jgi:flavodoxin
MKALVVYDSEYGNTQQVAKAIAEAIGGGTRYLDVDDARQASLEELDLLVVGSPTQGGRPTKATQAFLKGLPRLDGTAVAAFDTRIDSAKSGFFLRALMGVIGSAAPRIDAALRGKGGTLAARPAGFFVTGKEGPLEDSELWRAAAWAGLMVGDGEAVGA